MPFLSAVEGRFGYGAPQIFTTILQQNLQIWLDANNSSSQVSGTTWSNLITANSNFNYKLVNTPTLSTIVSNGTSRNAIAFNGASVQYATPSTSLLTVASNASWNETREYWIRWRGINGNFTSENGVQTPDTSWFDAQAAFIGANLSFSVWQNGPMTAQNVQNGGSALSNNWLHVVWQHNKATNTLIAYVNGVQTQSNNAVARTTPDSIANNGFFIALGAGSSTNYGTANYFYGEIAAFRWQTSILTSNQINSNFQAERGFQGI